MANSSANFDSDQSGTTSGKENKIRSNQNSNNSNKTTKSSGQTDFYTVQSNLLVNDQPAQSTSKCSSILKTGARIGLGGIGVFAGMFYAGPSYHCATGQYAPYCGEWLSNLITVPGARAIYFAFGASGFVTGAVFMGADSAEKAIKYVRAGNGYVLKFMRFAGVAVITAISEVPIIVMTRNAATSSWAALAAAGGNAPGAVYGAAGFLEVDVPHLLSVAYGLMSDASYTLFNRIYTKQQKEEWKQANQDREKRSEFVKKIRNYMTDVITHADNFKITDEEARRTELNPDDPEWLDPLIVLYNAKYDENGEQREDGYNQTLFGSENRLTKNHQFARNVANIAGLYLATTFSAASISNTQKEIHSWLPEVVNHLSPPVSRLLTAGEFVTSGVFNATMIYGNIVLTSRFLEFGVDLFYAAFIKRNLKSLNSGIFQLYPKLATSLGIVSLLVSSLSYSAIAIATLQEFATFYNATNSTNITNPNYPNGTYTDNSFTVSLSPVVIALYIQAILGINGYHARSQDELLNTVVGSFTSDKKTRFLLKTGEDRVQEMEKMPQGKFDEWVEEAMNGNNSKIYENMGLKPIEVKKEQENLNVNDELIPIKNDDKHKDDFSLEDPNPGMCRGMWGTVTNFFSRCCNRTEEKEIIRPNMRSYGHS